MTDLDFSSPIADNPMSLVDVIPRGIEAVWKLNAGDIWEVTLNDRTDLEECYWLDDVDGLWDADIRVTSQDLPDDHGEIPLTAYYGGHTLVFSGLIYARSLQRLREMWRDLRRSVQPLVEFTCLIDTGSPLTSATFKARKASSLPGGDRQINSRWERPFLISLRMSDPRFYSFQQHTDTYTPSDVTILGRDYPRTYPTDYHTFIDSTGHAVTPGAGLTAYNAGNFPSRPIFVLNGPLPFPTIKNNTTGAQMALNRDIGVGQSLTIDVASRTVIDENGFNAFATWVKGNNWVELGEGYNDLTVTVQTFQGGTIDVYWFDTYL